MPCRELTLPEPPRVPATTTPEAEAALRQHHVETPSRLIAGSPWLTPSGALPADRQTPLRRVGPTAPSRRGSTPAAACAGAAAICTARARAPSRLWVVGVQAAPRRRRAGGISESEWAC